LELSGIKTKGGIWVLELTFGFRCSFNWN